MTVPALDLDPDIRLVVFKDIGDHDRLILYSLDRHDDIWMNIRPTSTWERISLPQEYRNKPLLMFGRGDSSIVVSVRRDARTTVVLHSRDYGRSWTMELETGAEHRGRVLYTKGDTAVVYDARDKVLNLRSPSGSWSVSGLTDGKPVESWTTAGSALVVRSDTTLVRRGRRCQRVSYRERHPELTTRTP